MYTSTSIEVLLQSREFLTLSGGEFPPVVQLIHSLKCRAFWAIWVFTPCPVMVTVTRHRRIVTPTRAPGHITGVLATQPMRTAA